MEVLLMGNGQLCNKCGSLNVVDAVFCSNCGNNLTIPPMGAPMPVMTHTGYPATANPYPPYAPIMQLNYAKAGLGSRFLAHLVDSFVVMIPMLPGFLLLAGGKSAQVIGSILIFIAFCWALYYGICKDGFEGGQSYGKKMNNLMVIDIMTNRTCTKGKSFLRALGFAIPYVGGIIEIVMVLASDKGRRLGDLFAGTQVIEVSEYRR